MALTLSYTQESLHVLGGSTGLLTHTATYKQPPGTAVNPLYFFSMFTADGVDIWVGGASSGSGGDIADANTFWRSIDGGANWTNEAATHPSGKLAYVYSIFGVDGEMWAASGVWDSGSRIHKWNSVTEVWDEEYTTGAFNKGANCLWGPSATEMYCVFQYNTTVQLKRQDGGGWDDEADSANDFDTVANTGHTAYATTLVGDGTKLFIWTRVGAQADFYIYSGTFNGNDWVQEARSWDESQAFWGNIEGFGGRNIGCDETGAIWLGMYHSVTNIVQVHRRDPATGVWALSNTFSGGVRGGALYVVDSGLVVVGGGTMIGVWNGSVWKEYDTDDFVGWNDVIMPCEVWAKRA